MVQCNIDGCKKYANYGLEYKQPIRCNIHREKDHRNVTTKRCIDCIETIAFFGIEKGKATHCSSCKDDTMFNVKQELCIKCNKTTPTYGFIGDSLPRWCAKCKTPDMLDVKNSKCHKCKETKPTYGLEIGKATHCYKCKTPEMFDVLHTKDMCINCHQVRANYGLEKNNATHCVKCKSSEMWNVLAKMCEVCGLKQPSFSTSKEIPATHCGDCKSKEMICIHTKKCVVCNIKQPCFGLVEKKPTHCFDCKDDNMTNVKGKRCIFEDCDSQPSNPAYNGYCAYHFGNLFPDEPIAKNYKTKERKVVDYIREKFPNYTWKFDKLIEDGCSKRRPDIFLDLGFQVIVIEIDENQHKVYEDICENKRLMEISQDINHRPLIFIRFNPDKYTDTNNKNVPSCYSIDKKSGLCKINNNKNWKGRLDKLKENIDGWIKNETDKTVELVELFYNEV
jgi:hypothetical protein